MRILMINKFHWLCGGTERYVTELTALLEQNGHEIVPFAMGDPRNEPSPYANYFVSPLDFFDKGQRPAAWKVAERVIYSREARQRITQLVEATQPDLAHVNNIHHHISPSILDALHELQVPTIMTLHDYKLICPAYTLWTHGQICERCQKGRFYHCTLRRCNHGSLAGSLLNTLEMYVHRVIRIYDKVKLFVSPSRFLRDKHIQQGISPARIVHIPNFVIQENYTPCFDSDDYFAYVGRLTPFKGVGTLLDAMVRLGPSLPLFIVGDGPSKEELQTQARRLKLENVRFLGYRSGPELLDLIARAKFVVVPSEWYENCPYAVLEAFALGTPVLATAVGGIPELVKDNVNGMLVPHSDPGQLAAGLQRMIQMGSSLSEMGRASRKYLEKTHGEERYLSDLLQIYARAGAPV